MTAKNKIRSSNFDIEIFSDASRTGWGAVCGNEKANGFWSANEKNKHINYLEIKAAFLGLKHFASSAFDKQILLRIDITALAYLNKMGGHQTQGSTRFIKKIMGMVHREKNLGIRRIRRFERKPGGRAVENHESRH